MVPWTARLAGLHRVARQYSVYTLTFWTFMAGAFLTARIGYSGSRHYAFLVWNLFLAWLPYLCSLWAEWEHRRRPERWWRLLTPGVIWLLFLPNAPYIVTDLIHLNDPRPPIPLWYDALLVSAFACAGCLLGVVSLRIMQFRVQTWAGAAAGWGFVLAVIGLCGLGVYMGRVLRWNSWDVLAEPAGMARTLLRAMADPLSHWPAIAASLAFAGFMLACYLTVVTFRPAPADE